MVILIDEKKEKKYETRGNAGDFVDFLWKAEPPRKLVPPRRKIDTHKKLNLPAWVSDKKDEIWKKWKKFKM